MTLAVSERASNAGRTRRPGPPAAEPRAARPTKPRVVLVSGPGVGFHGAVGDFGCESSTLGCPAPAGVPAFGSEAGLHRADGKETPIVRMPDGSLYPGDLVTDILDYRRFRALALTHPSVLADPRLQELEERLRAVPREDGGLNVRAYHRFDIALKLKLRVTNDERAVLLDVETQNVSAGGMKISIPQERPAGERVWVLLTRGSSVVILPARIIWSRGPAAGLMFAGAPSAKRIEPRTRRRP